MSVPMSYTAVVERDRTWKGAFASEPYEVAWAHEAIFFVRALSVNLSGAVVEARVQISPDGMHWSDEGSRFGLPSAADEVTFVKVNHFGGWLRIVGEVPAELEITVLLYLTLKA